MFVYCFDPETHAYTGRLQLDESDRSPVDRTQYIIPGSCLRHPPRIVEGTTPYERNGRWINRVNPQPVISNEETAVNKLKRFLADNPDVAALLK